MRHFFSETGPEGAGGKQDAVAVEVSGTLETASHRETEFSPKGEGARGDSVTITDGYGATNINVRKCTLGRRLDSASRLVKKAPGEARV